MPAMNCKARKVKEHWWGVGRRGRQCSAEDLITQDPPVRSHGLFEVWWKVTKGLQQWKDVTLSSLCCCTEKRLNQNKSGCRLCIKDYCKQESKVVQTEGMSVVMERSSRTEEAFWRYNILEYLIDN